MYRRNWVTGYLSLNIIYDLWFFFFRFLHAYVFIQKNQKKIIFGGGRIFSTHHRDPREKRRRIKFSYLIILDGHGRFLLLMRSLKLASARDRGFEMKGNLDTLKNWVRIIVHTCATASPLEYKFKSLYIYLL